MSGEKREDGKIKFLFAIFNKIGFAPWQQDFRTDWKQKGSERIIQGIHPGIGKAGCFGRRIRWGTLEQPCAGSGGKCQGRYTIHI